jgi:hypothetical protein
MLLSSLLHFFRPLPVLILMVISLSCSRRESRFQQISPARSGITFVNRILENDSINQLDIENIYNGGGVGIGDFNRDGLPDIFFTGNLVSCKLYLNQGDFVFRDVTEAAGVTGEGKWCRGVAVLDINCDGLQDIYVSATLRNRQEERKNLLYVHQGFNSENLPVFQEKAAEYGLDDDSHTSQAVFFDYDNDGDQDVYLVVNDINESPSPYMFRPVLKKGLNPSTGKLYRNEWNDSLGHPVFRDVSAESGIDTEGYGHSASILDINGDGWQDIYVSNDYLTNDLLWINNGDGTFTDRLQLYFKHTSANSMGHDVGDINNDGLPDLFTLDMNPEDNYRKKMMMNPAFYQIYQNTERYGYSYQYVRNTLQLNQGPRVGESDSIGPPVFSEIAYFANVAATDWSWTPMITDLDNDGYRDLFICNGFPRDITDKDFGMFRNRAHQVATKSEILTQIPEVKLHNYVFRNNADLTFTDVSELWGLSVPTFSNGAVYADLDRDGDLDVVINNINDPASVYRNNTRESDPERSHYLQVTFRGDRLNPQGLGVSVAIYYDHGKRQVWESHPFRGYLSTVEDRAHFGLGATQQVDSVIIRWPLGRVQHLRQVQADQIISVRAEDALEIPPRDRPLLATGSLFREVTHAVNIQYTHQEEDFIDFNIQKLLPHKFSEYGPALAAGDMDGNGLDDIITGGSAGYSARLFLQQRDGRFIEKALLTDRQASEKRADDTGILLFDADGDGDLDLYTAAGGFENEPETEAYRDRFYLNDGQGRFTEQLEALPRNYTSKFCVRAADVDHDGDLDLFVAGRVMPWNYPKPVSSMLLRNDTRDGKVRFTDVTRELAGDLLDIGLVCDALFTDADGDGWTDLMLVGEWMPITLLKNERGTFRNRTENTGLEEQTGWWNTLAGGDFDNDGDIDYIAGNLGLNSFYRTHPQYPASVYAGDFDNDGTYDAFPALYLPTSQEDTVMRQFPAHTRDDVIKQMISMRARFQHYRSYANATMDHLFSEEQQKHALVLDARNFTSSYCRNDGGGRFTLVPMPAEAQLSLLKGMVADDFDGDRNLDLLISGNDWGTEVTVGRYDALNGLLLKGNGQGGFTPLSILESGIYIPGNGKGLVKLAGAGGRYLIAAAQNRGPLKIFELKSHPVQVLPKPNEVFADILFNDGTRQRQEVYRGASFLSQSSRFITTTGPFTSIILYDHSGNARTIKP